MAVVPSTLWGVKSPGPPKGLEAAGRRVWRTAVNDLPPGYEFDGRELLVLERACNQADVNAHLDALVAKDGYLDVGSAGQTRVSTVVVEARQGRIALARLLGELKFPDEDAVPRTSRSRRSLEANRVRWADGTQAS